MKFDKKGEKINSYNSGLMKDNSGLMKDEGGHGPKGTAMSNMWGGESVELGKQMGANRDFLKGPGSKHRNSEGTFNVEHSGIVKQGMDSGIYKMQQSGMHKMGGDEGGAPFHVIEARNTAVETLQDSRDKENALRDEGFEAAGESVESIAEETGLKEKDEEESPEGDTEIYSGDDIEKLKKKDEDLTSVEHDSEYDNKMRAHYGY